ncbi:hypothetical protein C5471_11695 [Photorhabdus tasmaniensis]|uniref:Transposase DDE domain-containing protein n=1 Tax=Photorhabdus tasmaniensis TaxID=1004159 RepID=A0ABX0GHQ4_9GAMM|nr:hypothetical protein [Photorhabdus tasmaniensis]
MVLIAYKLRIPHTLNLKPLENTLQHIIFIGFSLRQLQRIFEEIFHGPIQMLFYFRPGMINNSA